MRILIIKLSSLGDLFHALPAVHNLKTGLDADIDWVTHDYYVDLVKCFTDVDRVIPFYRKSFFRTFYQFQELLRKYEYDYIIDLQGLLKSAVVAGLARGKKRIGPSFFREGTRLFYHETAGKRNKERHAVDENMDIIRHLGLTEIAPVFPVKFPDINMDGTCPRIAVVPSSRWNSKNWPEECYIDALRRIEKLKKVSFYLLGGGGDTELCGRIEKALDAPAINMAGKSSLVEMGGILKQMDLLISNDSGPVHMAAAVGTPVLVVFGPTDPARTGPYGGKHRVVNVKLGCQPCFSRTCHMEGIPCLEGVTPERVSEVALEMLA